LLNFNPVFSNFSLWGLDFEGVNARLVRCVVPVLLPIQDFTQASALVPWCGQSELIDWQGSGSNGRYLLIQ
jgi:hypothetical protein